MDVATDPKVDVEAVAAWVPLRSPQVRECVTELAAQRPEESRDIGPQLDGIVVSGAAIGERP